MEGDWKSIASRRKVEIESKIPESYRLAPTQLAQQNSINIPRECGILSSREIVITESRAVDLVKKLANGEYTAVEVAIAFCKRAAIAHQVTNCLAWILFDEALKDAAALDEYFMLHGKPKGPLHGLPISVKEHIYLAGTYATSGLICWADQMSPGDALITKIFREAGAVFHVKTTNPQTLMALETDSNLYGRTTNPYNKDLSPGGSSGGEGALIAMRGSPLGIGTDMGGSIRVPSAFNGIYGLKGSIARFPHGGLSGLGAGLETIIGCVGPMANCVDDLELFCEVALKASPWRYEPTLIEMPWNPVPELDRKLKIGVLWHDGVVIPHPPVQRVLKTAVNALRSTGHTVVEFDPRLHAELQEWSYESYFMEGGSEYAEVLEAGKEPAVPIIKAVLDLPHHSFSLEESWKFQSKRDRLRTEYLTQWREAGIDALICPANAVAAVAHGEARYWGYTTVFNATDLSAVVFPAGKVEESDC